MPIARRLQIFLADGTRLVVLAGLIVVLQLVLPGFRSGPSTAEAAARARDDARLRQTLVEAERGLRDVLDSTRSIAEEQRELRENVSELRREALGADEEFGERLAVLRRSVDEGLEVERVRLAGAASRVDENASRIATISSRFDRDPPAMRRQMIAPTVQLRGNGTVGSGVLVYSELQSLGEEDGERIYTTFVLTAYHVVLEVTGDRPKSGLVKEVRVITDLASGKTDSFEAEMVLQDRDRDLALLRLNTTRGFRMLARLLARRSLERVDIFSTAYAVGCPLGNAPLPTLGEVSSRNKEVGSQTFWMLNAPTFFGNSGGGVYLADTCELIGISSMIYTYGKRAPTVVPHMGLFVPLESVYEWLDERGFEFVHLRRPIPSPRVAELVHVPPRAGVESEGDPAGQL